MSIPNYQLKGVLVPQLMRVKCLNPKTNTIISDTGDIEVKSEVHRIIQVHAFKSNMILIFKKAPTCIDGQLVLSLTKQIN